MKAEIIRVIQWIARRIMSSSELLRLNSLRLEWSLGGQRNERAREFERARDLSPNQQCGMSTFCWELCKTSCNEIETRSGGQMLIAQNVTLKYFPPRELQITPKTLPWCNDRVLLTGCNPYLVLWRMIERSQVPIRRATHKSTRACLSGQLYGQRGAGFSRKREPEARRSAGNCRFFAVVSRFCVLFRWLRGTSKGGRVPRNRKCGDSAGIDGRAGQCLPW